MPILLTDLIDTLPHDTPERVRRAKERFNERIREALRRETRLSLHRGARDGRDRREDTIQVGISVEPGLPKALIPAEHQTIEDRYHLAILLGPFRETLTALHESGRAVAGDLLPVLKNDPKAAMLLNDGQEHVNAASEYADFLLKKLNEFQLTKFILKANEDILGVYRYQKPRSYDDPKPKIELYWGVIGLVAQDLGINLEALTGVVLAHELAHAYSHVGSDADDHYWSTERFAGSDHSLKEGLAQYYTLRVCQRLEETFSTLRVAFETLLPHQPDAYKVHKDFEPATSEQVRLAMLEIRRTRSKGTLAEFMDRLEMGNDQLTIAPADTAKRLW
jgi:hypothetical protein